MVGFIDKVRAFAKDEEGVSAIEYGLIAALIAVVIAAVLQSTGTNLRTVFNRVCTSLNAGACAN